MIKSGSDGENDADCGILSIGIPCCNNGSEARQTLLLYRRSKFIVDGKRAMRDA